MLYGLWCWLVFGISVWWGVTYCTLWHIWMYFIIKWWMDGLDLPDDRLRCCAAWLGSWGRCVCGSVRPWIRGISCIRAERYRHSLPIPSRHREIRLYQSKYQIKIIVNDDDAKCVITRPLFSFGSFVTSLHQILPIDCCNSILKWRLVSYLHMFCLRKESNENN